MYRVYEEMDPQFAAKCSDATICSNTKGFFSSLLDELVSLTSPSWLEQLESLGEDKKVAFVMEHKEIMEALSEVFARIQPLHRGKNARVSVEKRAAAEKLLQEGDHKKALALASQAVLRAPMTGKEDFIDDGKTLALALWTRSEILMRCKMYDAALEDLRLALKERLPAKIRGLYYWRMGHCCKGAGDNVKAKVTYELARKILEKNVEAQSQITKDLEALDKENVIVAKVSSERTCVSLTGGAKQNMPSLSNLLKICEEENKGRFAVANSAIKPGDVLLIDSPYAACLVSDYYGTHCLHCFKRLEDCQNSAPIWCPNCAGVAFCSVQCRDTAVSTYHSYECQYLDLLIGSGLSILGHIALRMITQAGLDTSLSIHSKYISNEIKMVEGMVINDVEGPSMKSKMKCRKRRLGRSGKSLSTENSTKEDVTTTAEDKMSFEEKLELKATQIYSLCTHWDQRYGDNYLKRIVIAMFLSECLKHAGYFKNCEKDNVAKAQRAISELLVRNLQLLQFNAHEIYETLRGRHMFSGSRPLHIAVGIYPTGALFNHECYPAVVRYFDGRNIVLRATRPLTPGEMVSENYGPHFMMRDLRERQRSLACRYWFKCQCQACMEDWPTLKQMQKDQLVYLRCPNMACSWKFRADPKRVPSRCVKCSVNIDPELVRVSVDTVDRCNEMYQEGAKLMEAEKPHEAIAALVTAIETFHEVARPPHRETHLAQETLRTCYAVQGNVHIATEHQDDKEKNTK